MAQLLEGVPGGPLRIVSTDAFAIMIASYQIVT
jgi:hypothetical protein